VTLSQIPSCAICDMSWQTPQLEGESTSGKTFLTKSLGGQGDGKAFNVYPTPTMDSRFPLAGPPLFGRLAWAPRDSYFPGFSRITVEHKGSTCPPSLATFSRIIVEQGRWSAPRAQTARRQRADSAQTARRQRADSAQTARS